MTVGDPSSAKPYLSVVTITRHAAERIGAVVANALALGDESVVVDTGSSDDTVRQAELAGARVVSLEATSFDFSRARNVGTTAARGSWVLHLDDDESIDPRFRARLYRRMSEGWSCLRVLQQDYAGDEPVLRSRSHQPRLFERRAFEHGGRIFEWIYPAAPCVDADILVCHRPASLAPRAEARALEQRRRLIAAELDSILTARINGGEQNLARLASRCRHLLPWVTPAIAHTLGSIVASTYRAGRALGVNGPYLQFEAGAFLSHPEVASVFTPPDVYRTLSGRSLPPDYLMAAAGWLWSGDPTTAREALTRALAAARSAKLFHSASTLLYTHHQEDEARDAHRRAREPFPEDPCVSVTLEERQRLVRSRINR